MALVRQLTNIKWICAHLVMLAEPNLAVCVASTHGEWVFRMERKADSKLYAVTYHGPNVVDSSEYTDGPEEVKEEILQEIRERRAAVAAAGAAAGRRGSMDGELCI